MEQPTRRYMTRETFRRWAEEQPDGLRFERVAGEPVAIPPEWIIHARLKARIWRALDRALAPKGATARPCPMASLFF